MKNVTDMPEKLHFLVVLYNGVFTIGYVIYTQHTERGDSFTAGQINLATNPPTTPTADWHNATRIRPLSGFLQLPLFHFIREIIEIKASLRSFYVIYEFVGGL